MEKLSQAVGALVLVASTYLYITGGVGTSSPDVSALRSTGLTRADARLIASYVRAYGDIVADDGRRSDPYIETIRELKLKMRDVGNLAVGTGWKIGEKYPQLPTVLAGHFSGMEELDRAAFQKIAHALADTLEKV